MAAFRAAPDVSEESLAATRSSWTSAPPSPPGVRPVACPPSSPAPCPSHLARAIPQRQSLFSPRRARRATISLGLCAIKQRSGSAHVTIPFAKRAVHVGPAVRGGAQVGQALTRRRGGLCIKRKFIKDGQGKDEDKGADDGGGHATGRGWACRSPAMGQGGGATA